MKLYSHILILLLLSASFHVFAESLTNLNPKQVSNLQQNNALVIDIRTTQEWQQSGVIPQSKTIEFFNGKGQYDVDAWLKQFNALRKSPDQPVILVCHSGNRSKKVGDLLATQLGMKNIYHLQNGMSSWIKEGRPTDKDCPVKLACNSQQ